VADVSTSTKAPGSTEVATAFWICALVTLLSALLSTGFCIAALSSSGDAHINALRAFGRSGSLALACILAVFMRSRAALVVLSLTMTLVQASDAVIGASDRNTARTVGPAVIALATLASLAFFLKSAPRTGS
jgi:hypothetical protein